MKYPVTSSCEWVSGCLVIQYIWSRFYIIATTIINDDHSDADVPVPNEKENAFRSTARPSYRSLWYWAAHTSNNLLCSVLLLLLVVGSWLSVAPQTQEILYKEQHPKRQPRPFEMKPIFLSLNTKGHPIHGHALSYLFFFWRRADPPSNKEN